MPPEIVESVRYLTPGMLYQTWFYHTHFPDWKQRFVDVYGLLKKLALALNRSMILEFR